MTDRKKKGVTMMVTGGLGIAAGIIVYATTQTPTWVPLVIQVVGIVAGFFGITVVYPDTD